VIVLGGAFYEPGNVNPVAEANIFGDPEAADLVFHKSGLNIHMLPLDTLHLCLFHEDRIHALARKGDHGKFINRIAQFYLDFHKNCGDTEIPGIFVHDAIAVALVVSPELFMTNSATKVRVVTQGCTRGQTVALTGHRRYISAHGWSDGQAANVWVVTAIREAAMLTLMEERVVS